MYRNLIVHIVVQLLVAYTANGCPETCNCQDNTMTDVLFLACEGITTSNVLRQIAAAIPKNTTALGIAHYEHDRFLTEFFPVLKNLRILSIQGGTMKETPEYLGKIFPNLNSLYIGKNEIEKISPDTFKKLRELKSINLNNNLIETIKSGTFKYAKNLEVINLHSNRIKKISSNSFEGLTKLNTVMLQNNFIRHLKPGTFNFAKTRSFRGFSEINFEGNRIKKIPNGLFRGIRAIMILNFQDNFISHIEDKAFHHVQMILHLKLSKNFIREFPITTIAWYDRPFLGRQYTNMVSLDLLENPIKCDCQLVRLFTKMRQKSMEASIQAICKHPKIYQNQPFFTHFLPARIQECFIG